MSEVVLDINGLELKGYHGALEEEQRAGQRFFFDVRLVVHDAGIRSDQLADTVDYTAVAACIRKVNDARRFNLIEALAAAVADELLARFPVASVRVRVRKPEVRLADPVAFTAATVERPPR
ncbi:MAG TPA: dihydroneopterin aldolase [Gaiellaceae bacterium]|nr:dihydroneopterin aldolase [Gaiellaceae bacterium]